MGTLGRFAAEMVRILGLLVIMLVLLGNMEKLVYARFGIDADQHFAWLTFANLLIFFILYRNALQFSGWFRQGANKLPRGITAALLIAAAVMLTVPFIN